MELPSAEAVPGTPPPTMLQSNLGRSAHAPAEEAFHSLVAGQAAMVAPRNVEPDEAASWSLAEPCAAPDTAKWRAAIEAGLPVGSCARYRPPSDTVGGPGTARPFWLSAYHQPARSGESAVATPDQPSATAATSTDAAEAKARRLTCACPSPRAAAAASASKSPVQRPARCGCPIAGCSRRRRRGTTRSRADRG